MFITKTNRSQFYQLVIKTKNSRTNISTKTSDLTEAYKFMAAYSLAAKSEVHHEEIKQDRPAIIYLSNFRDEYVSHLEQTKSAHYIRSVKLSFKMLINFSGDIPLASVNLRTIDKFISTTYSRTARGASLYYKTLKAAFTKAVQWEYIFVNPFKKIKCPKVSMVFPAFISETELNMILDKTDEKYLKDLFYTAFYTGMRLGEILNMKWSWIDFTENQITVKCSDTFKTKSQKERIIPFNQNLKIIFSGRYPKVISINSSGFVFMGSLCRKLNENYVSKKFKQYARAANFDEKIHFHSLRHSFASLLVQKGVSLYVVKELLGHEELSTTQIYSHLQQQNLRDAVNLL